LQGGGKRREGGREGGRQAGMDGWRGGREGGRERGRESARVCAIKFISKSRSRAIAMIFGNLNKFVSPA
jgi:hypothetical protein